MFKKLFGGKKEKFFAQIDESKLAQPEVLAEPTPAPILEETAVAETASPKIKKTSVKKTKTAKPPTATVAASPAPAPVAVAPAPVDPKQVEFASQYLITQTLTRRLPGPSLNKFKEMVRQTTLR